MKVDHPFRRHLLAGLLATLFRWLWGGPSQPRAPSLASPSPSGLPPGEGELILSCSYDLEGRCLRIEYARRTPGHPGLAAWGQPCKFVPRPEYPLPDGPPYPRW